MTLGNPRASYLIQREKNNETRSAIAITICVQSLRSVSQLKFCFKPHQIFSN